MSKPNDPNTRTQIRALVEANAGTIMKNLNNFWHRSAEDLRAGGVPHAEIAESLMAVGITHGVIAMGDQALIAHLRRVADLYERLSTEQSSKREPPH